MNGKDTIRFILDGQAIDALPGETIRRAATRNGITIPNMCSGVNAHYRPDGSCRLCVVEVEGERTLAPSCRRMPSEGMNAYAFSSRAVKARKMVMEMLLSEQPARDRSHDPDSRLWKMAEAVGVTETRLPHTETPWPDQSHPAIAVHLDACIHCTNCVRACREVQGNDVIGMAGRGAGARIVFDMADPMGDSTCVACGECVQACPTGALMPAAALDSVGQKTLKIDHSVHSLCPYCGVGCQLDFHVSGGKIVAVDGRDGPANHNRLCVKGRFGFDYVHHPHRLAVPLIRREDAPPKNAAATIDPADPSSHFREASWDEALDHAAAGLKRIIERDGGAALAGFGSAKCSNEEAYLFQKLVRAGFGTNNVDHCTRLCHASSVAALMETIGSGAVTAPFMECANSDVIVVIGANPAVNHPVAATYIKNAVRAGAKLVVMDPRGQALSRHATHMLRFNNGTDVAMLNAMMHVIVEEGLVDEAFIADRTTGFEAIREHLKDFTPEKMAPICGIDADTLRTVARLYAQADAAMIFWGMGVAQHAHGTDNVRCLISLALMCGNIGRKGA
ncbi:MAG: molybdopterin-dependent oxidoreductase, partial [Rhodospirillales bacterium]|nr:molybdopterin-dependent oxidoreductase [Rhodospirillales bacterium]